MPTSVITISFCFSRVRVSLYSGRPTTSRLRTSSFFGRSCSTNFSPSSVIVLSYSFRDLRQIMYRITRNLASHFFSSSNSTITSRSSNAFLPHAHQRRGIMVKVVDGNVELALAQMTRKMRDSGMENLLKKKGYFERWMCEHHVKDSKRKYVNRRTIQYRIRNQELFKTLRTLLAKQMSGH